jgi:hypothetical protein
MSLLSAESISLDSTFNELLNLRKSLTVKKYKRKQEGIGDRMQNHQGDTISFF